MSVHESTSLVFTGFDDRATNLVIIAFISQVIRLGGQVTDIEISYMSQQYPVSSFGAIS
ncbi:hypothetical protein BaRGS_00001196, partial [Batillaria attramentaria]